MNILTTLKSYILSFKKATLVEDARLRADEIKLKTIPAYESAVKAFRKGLVSDVSQGFEKDYKKNVGSGTGMFESILARLKNLQAIVEMCGKRVGDQFEETTMIEGITVVKLNIIKLLEASSFISRYALHLLNYIYIHETAALMKDDNYIGDNLSKGQRKWVEDNFAEFCAVLAILGQSEKTIDKALEDMPDLAFGKEPEITIQAVGEHKINPLKVLNFSGGINNPIYHIRMLIAEYQVARYNEALELKKVLELRLLALETAQSKDPTPNPKVDQEITYTQGRVDRLNEAIRRAEESVQ